MGGSHQPPDCRDHWNLGAGRKKLSAIHVRQTGGLEPTGTGAVRGPARWCSLAGYTEHVFAIRFAAGPKEWFAAAGLRIHVLRQTPGGRLHDVRFHRGLLTNPNPQSPVTHDLGLVFHNTKARLPSRVGFSGVVEGGD